METKEIFGAAPFSVAEFLSDPGLGLYIPPYQRPYSWDKAKVRRLIEDIGHGLAQLQEISESICFLGTVIALRDLKWTTVEPVYHSEVPNKLLTIIDGQQRLSSLLILLTVLHEEIRLNAAKLAGTGNAADAWCYNQALDVTARLSATFQEDRNFGSGDYRFYPRMIRAYEDVWSRQEDQAKYRSSIGCYLFEYARHSRGADSNTQFSFKIKDDTPDGDSDTAGKASFAHLRGIRDDIRGLLRKQLRATATDDDEMEPALLSMDDIAASTMIREELFSGGVPEQVLTAATDNPSLATTIRLMVFAQYLLQRVTVAVVTAKREDFGFDMFEALNTTGEPLTALETFKPRVIRSFGLSEWRNSKTKAQFDQIEAYLAGRAGNSSEKRQTTTADLLISFALLQSGKRLGKRLSEQRRFMRQSFDEEGSQHGQAGYVEALANLTNFLDRPWSEPVKLSEELSDLESDGQFALGVLRDGKHEVVVPLLARYWTAYRLAPTETRTQRYRDFLAAARSCAAFYGLWRGASRGTAGIDDVYRTLMTKVDAESKLKWARKPNGSLTEVPAPDRLNEYLRSQLQDKALGDREKWAKLAAVNPVYPQRSLTRFLLIAASHDSLPDDKSPGLLRGGKPGLLPLMTLKNWQSEPLATIEHVTPQASANSWGAEVNDNPDLINTIGNLTLLPARENSSAGAKSWAVKRLFYRALSASTLGEAERLLEAASAEGVVLHSGAQEIVQSSQFLPLVSALATRDNGWDGAFIRQRGERLAQLAWDSLAPWLGYKENE